jgi:hypothetical protein
MNNEVFQIQKLLVKCLVSAKRGQFSAMQI